MTTTTAIYNLDDYTRLMFDNNGGYVLPDTVVDAIRTLCAEIGYDAGATQDTYINQHNATAPTTATKTFKPREQQRGRAKPDNWKAKSDFKVSKFAVLDDTEEILNEIRVFINQINDTNRDKKIGEICEKIDKLETDSAEDDLDENMARVFNLIYDTSMSNNQMTETYAVLLSAVYTKYTSHFQDALDKKIAAYSDSFTNIVEVDPNQNYDAFCDFTTQNIVRKKASSVFAEIAKMNTIPALNADYATATIRTMIQNVMSAISFKEKQKEVEETTENLIVYFAILGKIAAPLKAEYMGTFTEITNYKTSDKPGLNARTKFKYLDIVGK
jgi:hypothetical protein